MKRSLILYCAGLAIGIGICVALPDQPYFLNLAIQALIWGLAAASWDILGGFAGLVSFGHAGFFALGAYAAALVQLHFGVSVLSSFFIATVICGVAGLVVGFPSLRLHGHHLALATLAFGESIQLVARNWSSLTGGNFGLVDYGGFDQWTELQNLGNKAPLLLVFVIVMAVLAGLLYLARRSSVGTALQAIREDEILGESLGINTTNYKLLAFLVSAAVVGLGGAIYADTMGLVTPTLSAVGSSAMIVGMVIFGGIGTIWGPFLGGIILFAITEALRFVGVVSNLIAVGAIIIAFVILLPNGLAGIRIRKTRPTERADWLAARQSDGEEPDNRTSRRMEPASD